MKSLKEIFSGFGQTNETTTVTQSFSSCCSGGGHSHNHSSRPKKATAYQCPMKCEGSKKYDTPGNCPVCNMHLAPVGSHYNHHHHH